MTFKTGNRPWNKGLKGLANNGWTEERRREMSDRMRERYKDMGPQPQRWKTGPDPWVRQLRRKWLLAKNQARYFCQRWTITWPYFLDFMQKQHTHGRRPDSINLARINKRRGWTPNNIQLMQRSAAMRRPKAKDRKGNIIKRKRKNDHS